MKYPAYPKYKDSGVEWLGDVPEEWKIQKFRHSFKESGDKITGSVVGPMLSVSGYRGIEIKEYDDENRRRSDEDLVGYRIVRPGQLVVNTMWLNYAGLGVSEFEGHVSPAYRSYHIENVLYKRFVHHMMRSSLFVQGYTKFLTGIRPNSLQMSRDDLMSFALLLPSIEEQRAIATFLDYETAKIDALITEQEKLVALLQEKRQAVISRAVTKGLNPDAPMKDSGVEWLGEVPVGWNVFNFRRIITRIEQGWSPNASSEPCQNGDWGVLKISAVKFGRFVQGENKALLDDVLPIVTYQVFSGDLLLTRANTPDLVGDCCVVSDDLQYKLMMSDLIYRVQLAPEVDAHFASYLLRSNFGRSQIKADARGSSMTMAKISQGHIKDWVVVIPHLSEQQTIVEYLDTETTKIGTLITEANKAIELLKERRSAIISAAVTGKIDVRSIPLQETV
ncbi:MAG: hypothetical protein DELT_02218 [Desulfovibrio sp.]